MLTFIKYAPVWSEGCGEELPGWLPWQVVFFDVNGNDCSLNFQYRFQAVDQLRNIHRFGGYKF